MCEKQWWSSYIHWLCTYSPLRGKLTQIGKSWNLYFSNSRRWPEKDEFLISFSLIHTDIVEDCERDSSTVWGKSRFFTIVTFITAAAVVCFQVSRRSAVCWRARSNSSFLRSVDLDVVSVSGCLIQILLRKKRKSSHWFSLKSFNLLRSRMWKSSIKRRRERKWKWKILLKIFIKEKGFSFQWLMKWKRSDFLQNSNFSWPEKRRKARGRKISITRSEKVCVCRENSVRRNVFSSNFHSSKSI